RHEVSAHVSHKHGDRVSVGHDDSIQCVVRYLRHRPLADEPIPLVLVDEVFDEHDGLPLRVGALLSSPLPAVSRNTSSTCPLRLHDRPVFPRAFRRASRNCGLKPSAKDLALFASDVEANAAAVFTRNQFPGAPVILGRETIRGGRLRAIVANSKVSNVATGAKGVENAARMAAAAAAEIGTTADRVLVSSTGVIGVPLPIDIIERGIRGMSGDLQENPVVGAEGIMTTDTYAKALSVSVGDATITWVAKGSGMIEPNMATMLAYIFTDAAIESHDLDTLLREAVHVSFNMLSVDSDTSTSDTCAILANGLAGPGRRAAVSTRVREG